ncbi:hypothetical protein [Niabella ginsengisoli]|uniref:Transmembrane protein n=1 Tax=Niabella ginsengisoli TaxID=522298 RepID=A0ABS9SHW8_9BACT|nr:hypothetical protein [Niabella ginsengisoli]MCH5597930.1 hypothetical protein [Niabella ginsengisoli]
MMNDEDKIIFRMKMRIKDKRSVFVLAFEKVNAWMEKHQRRLAAHLNQKCAALSTKQLTMGLILFCLVFGATVVFTIWHSLKGFSESSKIGSISISKHISKKDSSRSPKWKALQFGYLQRIQLQIDSLQQTREGQRVWDSIKIFRPGLLDSLRQLEKMYQLNTTESKKAN